MKRNLEGGRKERTSRATGDRWNADKCEIRTKRSPFMRKWVCSRKLQTYCSLPQSCNDDKGLRKYLKTVALTRGEGREVIKYISLLLYYLITLGCFVLLHCFAKTLFWWMESKVVVIWVSIWKQLTKRDALKAVRGVGLIVQPLFSKSHEQYYKNFNPSLQPQRQAQTLKRLRSGSLALNEKI